jgi:hypothetical protein
MGKNKTMKVKVAPVMDDSLLESNKEEKYRESKFCSKLSVFLICKLHCAFYLYKDNMAKTNAF